MAEKTPAELRFDETTGNWTMHESRSEELCKDGKPHDWQGWRELEHGGTRVCSVCGITAIEHSMRYGP